MEQMSSYQEKKALFIAGLKKNNLFLDYSELFQGWEQRRGHLSARSSDVLYQHRLSESLLFNARNQPFSSPKVIKASREFHTPSPVKKQSIRRVKKSTTTMANNRVVPKNLFLDKLQRVNA